MDNKKEKLFTVKEAAKLIDGLTEYRIRQMCKNGQLDYFKAGNKLLISEESLYEAVHIKKKVAIYRFKALTRFAKCVIIKT